MAPVRMNDVVIVLPGITGSVLERDGEVIWGLTPGSAWRALHTLGGSLRSLRLDDPAADDGLAATRLMPDIHLVPGLVKIDGYSALLDELRTHFQVIEGSIHTDHPANLFPYPYDWRRDIRQVAGGLTDFLDERLARWRDHTNNPSSRAILIGHSMGGLVARYAVHVLGAASSTRMLITLGTPHRGSPNAVGFLANGYKKLMLDLTETMRSFPSVHQLMPIYPSIIRGDERLRPSELAIDGVNPALATDALAFHREIEAAVEAIEADDGRACTVVPVVGTGQPTQQSAVLDETGLRLGRDLPPGIDPILDGGDGTVPRLSAVPIELSGSPQSIHVGERHASLQNHPAVLNDLRHRLALTQSTGLENVRGAVVGPVARPTIGVDVDDAYVAGEDILIDAMIVGTDGDAARAVELGLQIRRADDGAVVVDRPMRRLADDRFRTDGSELAPGTYRVVVAPRGGGTEMPDPVHDVFVVTGPLNAPDE